MTLENWLKQYNGYTIDIQTEKTSFGKELVVLTVLSDDTKKYFAYLCE